MEITSVKHLDNWDCRMMFVALQPYGQISAHTLTTNLTYHTREEKLLGGRRRIWLLPAAPKQACAWIQRVKDCSRNLLVLVCTFPATISAGNYIFTTTSDACSICSAPEVTITGGNREGHDMKNNQRPFSEAKSNESSE